MGLRVSLKRKRPPDYYLLTEQGRALALLDDEQLLLKLAKETKFKNSAMILRFNYSKYTSQQWKYVRIWCITALQTENPGSLPIEDI